MQFANRQSHASNAGLHSKWMHVGQVLPTADGAYDMAETMAFDLAVKHADEMIGLEVAVSNTDGHKLFSVPVKASYLAAMPMMA